MSLSPAELLAHERTGVLATLSARQPGWPFASLVTYAIGRTGEPVFVLSDLAEHTRNLRHDPRASLLIYDTRAAHAHEGDPLAASRVTLLGQIAPVDDAESLADARERYARSHPSAVDYLDLADFRVYVLTVAEARPIGGFGDMAWLSGDALRRALTP